MNWPRATLLSGVVESSFCLLALIGWYLYLIERVVGAQMDATFRAAQGVPGEGAAYGMGFAALALFAIHPVTWVLAYFSVEGALRAFAAALTEETPGTLPLVLVDRLIMRKRRAAYEARVPEVPDAVVRGDASGRCDLKVFSSRPKRHWRYPLALRYQGEHYIVVGEAAEEATAARPHVYLLCRAETGEALRGLEDYDPNTAHAGLKPRTGFWSAFGQALRERYWVWRLPLVWDEVRLQQDEHGWWLEVWSCRPKPEWKTSRIIHYEDHYYRVESSRTGGGSRPFGYLLHRLPAGAPGPRVRLYTPEEPLLRWR